MQYFIMTEEQRLGPFTEAQLRERIQAGGVHAQTPVWHKGLEKWKPCGNLFGDMTELDSWFAMIGGEREGPMTPEAFQKGVNAGRFTASTIVWHTGMPRWRRLGKVAFDQGVDLVGRGATTPAIYSTSEHTPRMAIHGTPTPAPSASQFSAFTPRPSARAAVPVPGPRSAQIAAPFPAGAQARPQTKPPAGRPVPSQPPRSTPPPVPSPTQRQSSAAPPGIGNDTSNVGLIPMFDVEIDAPRPPSRPAPPPVPRLNLGKFDGVSPPFDYGGFWIRFLAILIDGLLIGMFVAVAMTVLGVSMAAFVGAVQPGPNATPQEVRAAAEAVSGMAGRILLVELLAVLYPILTTWWLGGSFGKLVCGLRVVRADGEALSFLRCFGREFTKVLLSNMLTLGVGFLLAAFSDEEKALHDTVCDTRVVKNR